MRSLAILLLVLGAAAAASATDPPPGEDETPACQAPNILCDGGATCVPPSALCDGECDCASGWDETQCAPLEDDPVPLPSCATCPGFRCLATGRCLRDVARRCDGTPDCADGSDEDDCPEPAAPDCTERALQCHHLTFDDLLPAGTVVTDQLQAQGIQRVWHEINPGRPGGGNLQRDIMVFDSENPTGLDSDLGSPNRECAGGGPGVGAGGRPLAAGENCVHHYGMLIISEDNDPTDPDDSAWGGNIVFDFSLPVDVSSVGALDVDDGGRDYVEAIFDDGREPVVASMLAVGNNGYQRVQLANATGVVQLKVRFWGSGAVTDLQYCAGGDEGGLVGTEMKCLLAEGRVHRRPVSANTYGEFASAFSPAQVDLFDGACAACIRLDTAPCVPETGAASTQTVECAETQREDGARRVETMTPRECHVVCPAAKEAAAAAAAAAAAGEATAEGRSASPMTPAECHGTPECVFLPAVSGELWGSDPFLYGDLVFTTQPEARSGVVSSVFTYHGTNTAESPVYEIILSFAGLATTTLVTNVQVWPVGGAAPLNHYQYVELPFAWDEAPHTYRVRWRPEYIEWWADGVLVRRLNAGGSAPVPDVAARVMAHSWAVSENRVVDPFRNLTGSFDTEDEATHRFCLECFQWHKSDGDECEQPPGGVCEAGGGTQAAVNGTCACPSAGTVTAEPAVRVLYNPSHHALTLEARLPYHPNARPLVALVPAALGEARSRVLEWACAGEGAAYPGDGGECLASEALAHPLEGLTSAAAGRANSACALGNPEYPAYNPDSPWFFQADPETDGCGLLATLTVPFDVLLGCEASGAVQLVPTDDGSIRIRARLLAAVLRPNMLESSAEFQANCTATASSVAELPFEVWLQPEVAETLLSGVAVADDKGRAAAPLAEAEAGGTVKLAVDATYVSVDGSVVMAVTLEQLAGPRVAGIANVGAQLEPTETPQFGDTRWIFYGPSSGQRFQTFEVTTADGETEQVQVNFRLAATAGENVDIVGEGSSSQSTSAALLSSRLAVMLGVLGVLSVFAVLAAVTRSRRRRRLGLVDTWCGGASAKEPVPPPAALSPRRRARRSPRKTRSAAARAARGLELSSVSIDTSAPPSGASTRTTSPAGSARGPASPASADTSSAAGSTTNLLQHGTAPAAAAPAAAAAQKANGDGAVMVRAPLGAPTEYADDLDGLSSDDDWSDAATDITVETVASSASASTVASTATAGSRRPGAARGRARKAGAAKRPAGKATRKKKAAGARKASKSPVKRAVDAKRSRKKRKPALEGPSL